jgi:hypothetical protein
MALRVDAAIFEITELMLDHEQAMVCRCAALAAFAETELLGSAARMPVPGRALFRRPQPGELRVEHSDSFGGGRPWCDAHGGGCGRRGHAGQKGAAGALVTSERSAATRADNPQLPGALVKENPGVVSHACLPDTTFAPVRNTSKSEVIVNQPLAIKRRLASGCHFEV